jgi:2,3-dihydroxybiphenyl 1,2-dioxygenase
MVAVSSLGYLGFQVSRLDEWEAFATGVLGLAVAERGAGGALALRLDDYRQRIVLEPGEADDLAFIGWEVGSGEDLEALRRRLEEAGVAVAEAAPEEAAQRRVAGLIGFTDPNGVPTELFHGPELAPEPFASPLVPSGFVTGELGLGHVFIAARDAAASEDFYRNVLGLRLSDYIETEMGGRAFRAVFLHANPRHHSISFAEGALPKRVDHFMLQLGDMDDVGAAYDRCHDLGVPITRTLGRHPNDLMFSFYGMTPSGFTFELGCGGIEVDDDTWRPRTHDSISAWGHRRPARP